MKPFKDAEGRTWEVRVTVETIRRARDVAGVDLAKVIDPAAGVSERLADPVALVDVLYCCCREDAEKRGISDEQFGRGMAGDALDAGLTALLEDLADFFPSGRGALLRQTLAKSRALGEAALRQAAEAVEALTLEDLLKPPAPPSTSSGSATSSPASAGSTPAP